MNEQIDGGGMPSPPAGDDDIKLDNKGQKIAIILVAIILVAGGVFAFVMFSQKAAAKETLETLKSDFAKVHTDGYEKFWKTADLDLDQLNTSALFDARLKEILDTSAIRYSEHIQSDALPVIEKSIPQYKALEAGGVLIPEIRAVYDAMKELEESWKSFASQVKLYKGYLDNRSKLNDISGKWMSAQQQPKNDEFKADAAKYLKVINCVLAQKDQAAIQHAPFDLRYRLKDTCAKADEQSDWFKRVAFECLDYVNQEVEASAVYQETITKYAEEDVQNQDSNSKFAIEHCLDLARESFETELSENIITAWANYVKTKNALLKKADEEIEAL